VQREGAVDPVVAFLAACAKRINIEVESKQELIEIAARQIFSVLLPLTLIYDQMPGLTRASVAANSKTLPYDLMMSLRLLSPRSR
jgi:hypothetical protein